MHKTNVDDFWMYVSVYRKYTWQDNPETPFKLRECSIYLRKYIESYNYEVRQYGSEHWVYPKPNSIIERPL